MRASLLLPLLVLLGSSTPSTAGDNFLSLDPFPNGRGLSSPASKQLDQDAIASKQALDAADKDLATRQMAAPDKQLVPDEQYARVLQQTFLAKRPSITNDNSALRLVATTDPNVLSDSNFIKNLQRLFQLQANEQLGQLPAGTTPTFVAPADKRIIGGLPTPDAVDVVGIVGAVPGDTDAFCSGQIISTDTRSSKILTAAHCVCESTSQTIRVGQHMFSRGAYRAFLVRARTLLYDGHYCPVRAAGEELEHFRLRIQDAVAGQDIAVLTTDGPIQGAIGRPRPILGPAAFASWTTDQTRNSYIRAVGYGFTVVTSDGYAAGEGNRLFADIAVVATTCDDYAAARYSCTPGKSLDQLVAMGTPFHDIHIDDQTAPDTCGGDSGGPIYAVVTENATAQFYTIGVTSRGTTDAISQHGTLACGGGGIYSLLTSPQVSAWLKTTFNAQMKG
ncbi:MAG TPA: trypsin-like serine protease [Rhizomicrobium sp.]|jgi:hypothetical protein